MDKSFIKGFLRNVGFKEADTEYMTNNLHEGEWMSHNWQCDVDYEAY